LRTPTIRVAIRDEVSRPSLLRLSGVRQWSWNSPGRGQAACFCSPPPCPPRKRRRAGSVEFAARNKRSIRCRPGSRTRAGPRPARQLVQVARDHCLARSWFSVTIGALGVDVYRVCSLYSCARRSRDPGTPSLIAPEVEWPDLLRHAHSQTICAPGRWPWKCRWRRVICRTSSRHARPWLPRFDRWPPRATG